MHCWNHTGIAVGTMEVFAQLHPEPERGTDLKNHPAQSASFSTNHCSSLLHFMARWKLWLSVGQSRNELLQATVEAWHYYQKSSH